MHTSGSLFPFFGFVKVTGTDAASFLHNQLSNDIQNLPEHSALYASYNNPKGRVLANMLVLRRHDDFILMMAQDLCASISKRLQMFVMRAKVTIECADDTFACAISLPEALLPPATGAPQLQALMLPTELNQGIWQITLPHGGHYLISDQRSLLPEHKSDIINAWQTYEIEQGYAWMSAATTETCVAQMLNFHLLGAVHFKKGCYPGQEIIARAQYRGQVKRGLAVMSSQTALQAGDAVFNAANEEVGIVINTSQIDEQTQALAVIKFSAATDVLKVNQHTISIQNLFF